MTASDTILAYIRTYVPYGIGAALAWLLAVFGLDLTGDFQVALVAFAVAIITNLYYLVIRVLEVQLPWVGAFLGFPKAPEYAVVDNLWASVIRTGIPTLAAAALVTLASWAGLHLDADNQTGLIVIAVAILEALYYAAARALVARWSALSFLLGPDFAPSYAPRHLRAGV